MDIKDIAILALVALWVAAAAVYAVRQKRKGKSLSCGGDCSKCAGCSRINKN